VRREELNALVDLLHKRAEIVNQVLRGAKHLIPAHCAMQAELDRLRTHLPKRAQCDEWKVSAHVGQHCVGGIEVSFTLASQRFLTFPRRPSRCRLFEVCGYFFAR
jgi:hypothetical protein